MFNLIKKDFINTLRIISVKSVLIIIFLSFILLPMINYYIPRFLPIVTTYFIVVNTFYCDYENKSDRFILSMPLKREDVIYSKYIFSISILLITIIITSIIASEKLFFLSRFIVMEDIYISINLFLIIMSIILPISFKYPYRTSKILNPIISILVGLFTFKFLSLISMKLNGLEEVAFKWIDTKYINFTTITIFFIVVFIFSMYVSVKFYKKKDIV
ncbi:ABC-2 transporter permease [Clostridium chauvoei]|uniref:ABC-2 transporter permease n=2 Tax=Clostridium chauvoei TaxID=46867 RepID=A0ABD4RKA3_9CLOT|nr:ABC-2 transporter permease [Clostridium chauvoei]ATD54468.1 hypothetical protein BTM20_04140 [Clostridium chauvoei]ATD57848.1 hypothetical protein BTM21_08920 [Clostridium chauvoei]MBX7281700.1 ABC-2 transporter permease [Clostridium chauvoei]MBX7284239.1 ABC-2 transporter permease [Clostridium chauvoei]MBX7286748.1 ABC-2 transporter permease [Clostridium chauvoei]